jgi:CheY-like chemotaxis protein
VKRERARDVSNVVRLEAVPNRPARARRPIRATTGDRPANGPADIGASSESSSPKAQVPPRTLRGLRVLVVDDDEGSLDYFSMALRSLGAVVVTASTALDAVRLFREQPPDVVLSDLAMPVHDGYWLVRELRELSVAAGRIVPVIAATAYGREHSRERALAAGFADHLRKPIDPEALWAAIGRFAH